MTVSTTSNKIGYAGNGSSTIFTFPFPIFAATDLRVVLRDSAGDETVWASGTDYTLSAAPWTSGGTITAAVSPASGETLLIKSAVAATQGIDLRDADSFPAETVERGFDRLTIIAQQNLETLDRTVQLPEATAITDFTLPDPTSGYVLYSPDGLSLDWADISTLGSGSVALPLGITQGGTGAITGLLALTALIAAATAPSTRNLLELGTSLSDVGGRLTFTAGSPTPTADQLAQTTVRLTPYKGCRIALYTGTKWVQYELTADLTVALPAAASQMYDVFLDYNAGTVQLALTAWTNDTTRATAIVYQHGVLCKTGDLEQRYLGSVRTTAVAGQSEDSLANRFLWNYYNRILRPMRAVDTTDSWTYTTAAFRQARASTANQLNFIIGVSEDSVFAQVTAMCNNAAGNVVYSGIGLDSTTVSSAQIAGFFVSAATSNPLSARYDGYPGVGRHYLSWLEYSAAGGTTTWIGDAGGTAQGQCGIVGGLMA